MALVLMQSGMTPAGWYDVFDTIQTTLKGGELVTFARFDTNASDDEAFDVRDGYVGTTGSARTELTTTMTSTSKPLFLADEGITGYGTIFGVVVGGSVGQVSTGGAVLGPHTTSGSGKVTIYGQPGFYATTLDACDTASDGIVGSNASLTPNMDLTYSVAGLLTPLGSAKAATCGGPAVARLQDLSHNGSLVSTPNSLVAALNSPSGAVGSANVAKFTMAIYWFGGGAVL